MSNFIMSISQDSQEMLVCKPDNLVNIDDIEPSDKSSDSVIEETEAVTQRNLSDDNTTNADQSQSDPKTGGRRGRKPDPEVVFSNLEKDRDRLTKITQTRRQLKYGMAWRCAQFISLMDRDEAKIKAFVTERGVKWPEDSATLPIENALVRHFFFGGDVNDDNKTRISEYAKVVLVLGKQGHINGQAAIKFVTDNCGAKGIYAGFDNNGNPKPTANSRQSGGGKKGQGDKEPTAGMLDSSAQLAAAKEALAVAEKITQPTPEEKDAVKLANLKVKLLTKLATVNVYGGGQYSKGVQPPVVNEVAEHEGFAVLLVHVTDGGYEFVANVTPPLPEMVAIAESVSKRTE